MPESWDSFFVAQVGGTAALTGLVFVALSINLARIVGDSLLVGRAAEALTLLVTPVIIGLIVLMPDHALATTGTWCAVAAAVTFVLVNSVLVRGRAPVEGRPAKALALRAVLVEVAILPSLIGAVVLISGSTAGFGWIAVGAVAAIVVGIFDAWVLLVEILR